MIAKMRTMSRNTLKSIPTKERKAFKHSSIRARSYARTRERELGTLAWLGDISITILCATTYLLLKWLFKDEAIA